MNYRDWLVTKLIKEPIEVSKLNKVTSVDSNLIEVITTDGKLVIVGVIENSLISDMDVQLFLNSGKSKPNIIIGKSNSIWTGDAINSVRKNNVGWGGIGEIHSTYDTDNYSLIQKREYNWVETNIMKHNKVRSLDRIFDRVFKVNRIGGLPSLKVVLINSYELSAEEVRNSVEAYGAFDVILKTNPNGTPTANAYLAAEELGAEICVWKELLVRLNKI